MIIFISSYSFLSMQLVHKLQLENDRVLFLFYNK